MTRRELLLTLQGLLDIAEATMTASDFRSDTRVTAGLEAREAVLEAIVGKAALERAL